MTQSGSLFIQKIHHKGFFIAEKDKPQKKQVLTPSNTQFNINPIYVQI